MPARTATRSIADANNTVSSPSRAAACDAAPSNIPAPPANTEISDVPGWYNQTRTETAGPVDPDVLRTYSHHAIRERTALRVPQRRFHAGPIPRSIPCRLQHRRPARASDVGPPVASG